jgi:hypothetical protein
MTTQRLFFMRVYTYIRMDSTRHAKSHPKTGRSPLGRYAYYSLTSTSSTANRTANEESQTGLPGCFSL